MIIQKLLIIGVPLLVATATSLFQAVFALRAKRRARDLVASDPEVVRNLNTGDVGAAIREIEKKTSSLSVEDRGYLRGGLHQQSVAGTKRFVREVTGPSTKTETGTGQ
jgi:hypothetical protein